MENQCYFCGADTFNRLYCSEDCRAFHARGMEERAGTRRVFARFGPHKGKLWRVAAVEILTGVVNV